MDKRQFPLYKNALFKGYGFLSFARILSAHAIKAAKYLSNKYGQKLPDTAKNL